MKHLCLLVSLTVAPLCANDSIVNCNAHGNLQNALNRAEPNETVYFTGTCLGPFSINRSGLSLQGKGTAILDGQKKDALTVYGAARVTLSDFDVQNGANGIVANDGAHVTILNTSVHGNLASGILVESNSSATLSGGGSVKNGLNGVDAEASSSLVISDDYKCEANQVFGLNVNGNSSVLFDHANLLIDQNILGVQIGTGASAFIADSSTKINVQNNFTTGFTIVSGSHMVAFGGTVIAQGNGVHGVSIDSKAGLDLDAAALLDSHGNGGDGVHLEETSVLTMFNTPAFSGAPGTTTLQTSNNAGNGINLETASSLTLINQAAVISQTNKGSGIKADNGSALTLIKSTVTGNAHDVSLSFGSRSDITSSTIGTISCDSSVLSRGATVCH